MKKVGLFWLILFLLTICTFAQSGRRIKNPIPGTTSSGNSNSTKLPDDPDDPVVEKAQSTSVGFSESASSQPLSIAVSRRNSSKPKETKKTPDPAPSASPKPTIGDDEVIKVDTSLISIPVTVYTRDGNFVPSLSKPNFQIFEDGKEQEVAYFGSVDKPFTVIMLIDVSGSTSMKIEQIQDGAIAFVHQLMPQDKVTVMSFDSGVYTLIENSSDKTAIEAAIRKVRFGGGTSLYEAVDNALRRKLQKVEGRKAIILFSDAVDTTSNRATYESTVSDALESDAVIYPIYFNTYLDNIGLRSGGGGPMTTSPVLGMPGMGGGGGNTAGVRAEYALGRRYIQDLSNATGGRIVRAENSSRGLITAFESIAEELRSQYEVGYYPINDGKVGDTRHIKIRINRPNLVIRNRDSYVVK